MYDYATKTGFGDCFYQYAFDASVLTNGQNYVQQFISVTDYDFIVRAWGGWETFLDPTTGSIQCYDDINRQWASGVMNLGSFATGSAVLPAKAYRVNSRIKFDLNNVLLAANGASQLVFSGVRRIPGAGGDPSPSPYKYKLVNFSYPFTLTVQQAPLAQVLYDIPVTDYDFELERVELTPYSSPSPFGITLFDSNKYARSNMPILSNRFFHFDPATSHGEQNFWPCPPLLYKVNSVIRIGISSLLAAGPVTYQLQFVGHRRIPCE